MKKIYRIYCLSTVILLCFLSEQALSQYSCPGVIQKLYGYVKKKDRQNILNQYGQPKYQYLEHKGYERYIKTYYNGWSAGVFRRVLSSLSKEEFELLGWRYIRFEVYGDYGELILKFANIVGFEKNSVIVEFFDDKGIKKRKKLNKQELKSVVVLPSSEGRVQFREALERGEFIGDHRYIRFFISRKGSLMGRVVQTQTKGAKKRVIVEILNHRGGLELIELSEEQLDKAEVSLDSKHWFYMSENAIKRLDSLSISESHVETTFIERGYRPVFVRGMGKMIRLQKFGKKLREFNIHPFKTHIEDFALQLGSHIEIVRKGIISQGEEVQERLKILAEFEKEAQQKIDETAMTYMYWLFLNQRLSILATPSHKRDTKEDWWKSHKSLEKVLDDYWKSLSVPNIGVSESIKIIQIFPSVIALPIIFEFDYMAIALASVDGIVPFALVGNKKWIDGTLQEPERAFDHDIIHYKLDFGTGVWASAIPMKLFHHQLMEKIDQWTSDEAEQVLTVYGLISHESLNVDIAHSDEVIETLLVLNFIERFQDITDLGYLLPNHVNRNSQKSIESYLKGMAEVFNEKTASIISDLKED